MKPDWKDAPEWANWLSMNEDGEWVWYENEPHTIRYSETWFSSGRFSHASYGKSWQESKEKRP